MFWLVRREVIQLQKKRKKQDMSTGSIVKTEVTNEEMGPSKDLKYRSLPLDADGHTTCQ